VRRRARPRRPRHDDPVAGYLSGLELWASDFLAVARGELDFMGVAFGRGRAWNADPGQLEVGFTDLWMYFHPLRQPDTYLRLYRRKLAGLAAVRPELRAAAPDRLTVGPGGPR
jgi:hypothetical protein